MSTATVATCLRCDCGNVSQSFSANAWVRSGVFTAAKEVLMRIRLRTIGIVLVVAAIICCFYNPLQFDRSNYGSRVLVIDNGLEGRYALSSRNVILFVYDSSNLDCVTSLARFETWANRNKSDFANFTIAKINWLDSRVNHSLDKWLRNQPWHRESIAPLGEVLLFRDGEVVRLSDDWWRDEETFRSEVGGYFVNQ